jgi:hypothetical protein
MHPLTDAWVYDHFSQNRPEVSAGVVLLVWPDAANAKIEL